MPVWTLLPLLAAIGVAYVIIRRIRLVRENRERAIAKEAVEKAFLQASEKFSVPGASSIVEKINACRLLRRRYLHPELSRLETSLKGASQWSGDADPEQERKEVLEGVAHLYVKWRQVRDSV